MSIDLSRPLVNSMGHHDPLDGLVTCLELRSSPGSTPEQKDQLDAATVDFGRICERGNWATEDPLGIGGVLDAAVRTMCVAERREQKELLSQLLCDAESSLRTYDRTAQLNRSADDRLAFRELGLSIGLRALELWSTAASGDPILSGMIRELLRYVQLAGQIESFWADPAHRRSKTWKDHEDINSVMLATSLAPDGYYEFDRCQT
jgi:hypothetical protein